MDSENIVRNGIIGMLVAMTIAWVTEHLSAVIGVFVAAWLAATILSPFFNDDINPSELRAIADRRVILDYATPYTGVGTNLRVKNPSNVTLTDVIITCGEEVITVGDIQPYTETLGSAKSTQKVCTLDYNVAGGYYSRVGDTVEG